MHVTLKKSHSRTLIISFVINFCLCSSDSVRGLVAEANFRLIRYGLPKVDISIASCDDKKTATTAAYQPEKQLEELRSLQVRAGYTKKQLKLILRVQSIV